MSIEQELTEAFKKSAGKLKRPETLDLRMEQQYRKQIFRKQSKLHAIKKSWTFRIFVVGLLLSTMGFSSQFVIQFKNDMFDYFIHHNEIKDYDAQLAKQMRESLEQLKQSLPVNGKGIYYANELKKLLPKTKYMPVAVVTNPYLWKSEEAWEKNMSAEHAELQFPDSLSHTLTFVSGQEEQPFGGQLSQNNLIHLNVLESRVKKEKLTEIWFPLPSERENNADYHVFTTTYESEPDEIIYITMELFSEESTFKVQSSIAKHEEIQVGNQSANYTLTKPFLFSDSDLYQSVYWMESYGEESVLYTIGSGAEQVTKQELTSIAEQFIH